MLSKVLILKNFVSLLICTGFLFCMYGCTVSQPISIIPKPQKITSHWGRFVLNSRTSIVANEKIRANAEQLQALLRPATGYPLEITTEPKKIRNAILLQLDEQAEPLGAEGYSLEVTSRTVTMRAPRPAGLFYACQTLRQLLPVQIYREATMKGIRWEIPCVKIEDHPRFTWRGAMLDSARYFMPKEFVKKFIDLLAMHKMNSFHWHLTDDQGWRIEIKKYPLLTEIGAWRKESIVGHYRDKPRKFDGIRHGGFYSQEDIREIVAYARARHINVVPEIEMPGHAQAAIAAYPELGNTKEKLDVSTVWGVHSNIYNANEETIRFLQDVLTEVLELFPSKFIHIGGDEARKDQWKASPAIQVRIQELNLKDEHELQSYFIKRMDAFLTSKGRRLIGWDEILQGGLAPNATVMSWRGEKGGITAAKAGHDVVMAPTTYTYLDYYQSRDPNEPLAIGGYLPLSKVYNYNPIPKELSQEQARHILGTQGQIWTEYIPNPKKAEYMAFPRLTALAEVAWTQNHRKDYIDFLERLNIHLQRLNALDVNYRPISPD